MQPSSPTSSVSNSFIPGGRVGFDNSVQTEAQKGSKNQSGNRNSGFSPSSSFKFFVLVGSARSLLLSRLFPSCGAHVSHCRGFSCCGAPALDCRGFRCCGSWALEHRLSSCGTQTWLLLGMWDLPEPRIKPRSPALADGFYTTESPGKALSPPSCICLRFIALWGQKGSEFQ